MKIDETFPLAWEQVLWSSSPAFPVSLARSRTQYAFTDFRLVIRRKHRTVDELPLDDIDGVSLSQSWWQRASGTSTVRIFSRRDGRPIEFANIHHGPQLALVLQLRATELFGDDTRNLDADFFKSALGPGARSIQRPRQGMVLAATMVCAVLFGLAGIARHTTLPPVVYAANDRIAPNGHRRSTEEITTFMERDVMPFARRVLAPLVGAAEDVTCETCHGEDAVKRNWKMPGVRALPEPQLRLAGLERARLWLDPQMRNAVYGYLAEEENQSTAAYMRQVVLPGMAELMNRPAYDFSRSYGYNRSRAAVGCYHCHLVE
jgi:hypothetical protein